METNKKNRSRFIIDFFENYGQLIACILAGAIILALCVYWIGFTRVTIGEDYIFTKNGTPAPPGVYNYDNVIQVDTSYQYCCISGKINPNMFQSSPHLGKYSTSSGAFYFKLKSEQDKKDENVTAIVLLTYHNTRNWYYPGGATDDNFVSDFVAAIEDVGRFHTFQGVKRNQENFTNALILKFNQTTMSHRILDDIKIIDLCED